MQEYLKQFNELFEELQSKKVGVMAVCAQPQDKVDEMEKKLNLKFKVSTLFNKVANTSIYRIAWYSEREKTFTDQVEVSISWELKLSRVALKQ